MPRRGGRHACTSRHISELLAALLCGSTNALSAHVWVQRDRQRPGASGPSDLHRQASGEWRHGSAPAEPSRHATHCWGAGGQRYWDECERDVRRAVVSDQSLRWRFQGPDRGSAACSSEENPTPSIAYDVRDMWNKRSLGVATCCIRATGLEEHECAFFRLTPVATPPGMEDSCDGFSGFEPVNGPAYANWSATHCLQVAF